MINREEFKFIDDLTYDVVPPTQYLPNGGIVIGWSTNIGFGEYTIMFDENGRPYADTECMDSDDDKWFTKKLLMKFADEMNIHG